MKTHQYTLSENSPLPGLTCYMLVPLYHPDCGDNSDCDVLIVTDTREEVVQAILNNNYGWEGPTDAEHRAAAEQIIDNQLNINPEFIPHIEELRKTKFAMMWSDFKHELIPTNRAAAIALLNWAVEDRRYKAYTEDFSKLRANCKKVFN